MSTPKEEVRKLLEALPDDSSMEDIQYEDTADYIARDSRQYAAALFVKYAT